MAVNAQQLAACLATIKDGAPGTLPVLFAGERIRCIGYAVTPDEVDILALRHRVSGTYVSRVQVAQADGTMSRPFFMLRGGDQR